MCYVFIFFGPFFVIVVIDYLLKNPLSLGINFSSDFTLLFFFFEGGGMDICFLRGEKPEKRKTLFFNNYICSFISKGRHSQE